MLFLLFFFSKCALYSEKYEVFCVYIKHGEQYSDENVIAAACSLRRVLNNLKSFLSADGHQNARRSQLLSSNDCPMVWQSCSQKVNCGFRVVWVVNSETKQIRFIFTSSLDLMAFRWMGIGFSKDARLVSIINVLFRPNELVSSILKAQSGTRPQLGDISEENNATGMRNVVYHYALQWAPVIVHIVITKTQQKITTVERPVRIEFPALESCPAR